MRVKRLKCDAFDCIIDKQANKSLCVLQSINILGLTVCLMRFLKDCLCLHDWRLIWELKLSLASLMLASLCLGLRRRHMGIQRENLSKCSKKLPTPKTTLFAQSVCRIRDKKKQKKNTHTFSSLHDVHLMRVCLSIQTRHVVAKTPTKNRACSVVYWWQNAWVYIEMTQNKIFGVFYQLKPHINSNIVLLLLETENK